MAGRFNFSAFIDSIADQSLADIVAAANSAAYRAEQASSGRGSPRAREEGVIEYRSALGRFLFWLGHGRIPDGMTDEDRRAYRRIGENLVAKQQLKPEILNHL